MLILPETRIDLILGKGCSKFSELMCIILLFSPTNNKICSNHLILHCGKGFQVKIKGQVPFKGDMISKEIKYD